MTVTVQDVMRQMRNYFIASTLTGTFTVADGIIDLDPPLAPGAWVAIEGSGSLDGVRVQEGTVQCPRQHRRAVIVFQNIPDLILCVLRKLVEGTIAGTVIRQTVRVDPWAVDVTEQIGGRFDDGRERCRVDAGFQCFTHGNKPSPGSTRGKALHIGKSVHIANRERLLSWENAHPRERKTNPTHIRMRPETERNNHERLQPDERHAE